MGNNPERMQSRVAVSAHRLILLNICMKFHENISNGFRVTERTRFCDRLRTPQAKTICLPFVGGGGGDIMTGLSKGVWNAITVLFDTEEDIRKLKSQALVMNYLFAIPWKVLRNKTVQPCSIILKIEVSR